MSEDKSEFSELAAKMVEGMEDMKASNITILDLRDIENSVTDFFVICEGTSNTQVNAITDSVEKRVREDLNDKPWHVEGRDNSEWILMDYVSAVAHIFLPEMRKFYDLESLWGDAKTIVWAQNYD